MHTNTPLTACRRPFVPYLREPSVEPHRSFDRFSCFNAFSRVDVRVDVKIPGGVNAYVVDLRGERYVVSAACLRPPRSIAPPNRHEAPDGIWQETYLSAVLRAILYSDDPTYFLEAYRRLELITAPDAELRFLQAAEALFMKGADFSLIVRRFEANVCVEM